VRRSSLDATLSSTLNVSDSRVNLPERHEPDGGEDAAAADDSEADWSDWEPEEVPPAPQSIVDDALPVAVKDSAVEEELDLSTLDIQVKVKEELVEQEIDYFADMEPTITSSCVYAEVEPEEIAQPGFNFSIQQEEEGNDGWNWDD